MCERGVLHLPCLHCAAVKAPVIVFVAGALGHLEVMVAKAKKQQKSSPTQPLKSSFEKSRRVPHKTAIRQAAAATAAPSSAPSTPLSQPADDISRSQCSGFLSYLRSATLGKDASSRNAATSVLEHYRSLDAVAKKECISTFFKMGGRKKGLEHLFSQRVSHKASEVEEEHEGYVTGKKLMKLHEVLWKWGHADHIS